MAVCTGYGAARKPGQKKQEVIMTRKLLKAVLMMLPAFIMAFGARAGELVLVDKGKSLAPIVVFSNAPPFTRQAADELVQYIEKTSGAKPEVIAGLPDPLPEHAVWVGYQPKLKELFPKIDFDFKHPEEILIACDGKNLVIAGRDRWDPAHMRVEGDSYLGRDAGLDGVQQEYGTCNAVYTFLQDQLGVRWLWPGDIGEDVVRKEIIAFAPFEYRYHPQFRGRADIFRWSSLYSFRGQSHDWLRFQRLQLDSLKIGGGHGFSKWWDRFHVDHPGYFALQPDGTRGGGDRPYPDARTVKICKSNPGVWTQWLKDVEAALEQNPNQQTFSAAANDSGASGYCVCTNCQAWDNPEGQKVGYTWSGLGMRYVTMADRQVTLANTLARMLKERYPGRDYYVTMFAYGNSRPPPARAVPDSNVICSSVANFHNRPSGDHREQFQAWGRVVPNLGWRPNLGYAAGWCTGFPNIAPRRVMEDMRFAADNNVIVIYFDTVWEHWANHGPHYYMLAQMAWNPRADGEAILADYYRRAFGPAAKTMTDYWTLIDNASGEIKFNGKKAEEAWSADFYRRAYACLDRAAGEVKDAPRVYGQRVAFVRAGLDYLRLYYENTALIARLKQGGFKDAGALEQARANWQKIVRIFEDHPVAFNQAYVSATRSNSRALAANPDWKPAASSPAKAPAKARDGDRKQESVKPAEPAPGFE